jgi:hypothetical protein
MSTSVESELLFVGSPRGQCTGEKQAADYSVSLSQSHHSIWMGHPAGRRVSWVDISADKTAERLLVFMQIPGDCHGYLGSTPACLTMSPLVMDLADT